MLFGGLTSMALLWQPIWLASSKSSKSDQNVKYIASFTHYISSWKKYINPMPSLKGNSISSKIDFERSLLRCIYAFIRFGSAQFLLLKSITSFADERCFHRVTIEISKICACRLSLCFAYNTNGHNNGRHVFDLQPNYNNWKYNFPDHYKTVNPIIGH